MSFAYPLSSACMSMPAWYVGIRCHGCFCYAAIEREGKGFADVCMELTIRKGYFTQWKGNSSDRMPSSLPS